MARKARARPMLQQLAAGTSRNAIARSLGVSKHSIQAVAEAAEREKVSWQDAEGMEEGELYSRLFPEKADAAECVYPDPDWDAIHRELRKTGVTLRLVFDSLELADWGWYRKSVPNDEAWRIACTPLNRGPGRSSSTSSTASRRRRR